MSALYSKKFEKQGAAAVLIVPQLLHYKAFLLNLKVSKTRKSSQESIMQYILSSKVL